MLGACLVLCREEERVLSFALGSLWGHPQSLWHGDR